MKNDFIKPILVLTLICLLVSGALAVTNSVTEPVIADAAAQRSEEAIRNTIPEAEGFEKVTSDSLPESVKEAYRTTNNVGYVFIVGTSGYGGDMLLICGIGPEGDIIRCATLEQSETKGLGSRITEAQFEQQFTGVDSSMEGVQAISGATISSTAYISAVRDALEAFGIVRGAE